MVKKSLQSPKVLVDAVGQLAGYVRHRTDERGQRYVGVLTDGQQWLLDHLRPDGTLAQVDEFRLAGPGDADELAAWLEVVLATTQQVTPTPREILRSLGAGSPSFQLDLADLHALYAACRTHSEVQLKRELWARLLVAALGTAFEANDELFVTHTYLVLTAELLAHAVVGIPLDAPGTDVRALLEGEQFQLAGQSSRERIRLRHLGVEERLELLDRLSDAEGHLTDGANVESLLAEAYEQIKVALHLHMWIRSRHSEAAIHDVHILLQPPHREGSLQHVADILVWSEKTLRRFPCGGEPSLDDPVLVSVGQCYQEGEEVAMTLRPSAIRLKLVDDRSCLVGDTQKAPRLTVLLLNAGHGPVGVPSRLLAVEQNELPDNVIEGAAEIVDGVAEQYPPAFRIGFLAKLDGERVATRLAVEILDVRTRIVVRELVKPAL